MKSRFGFFRVMAAAGDEAGSAGGVPENVVPFPGAVEPGAEGAPGAAGTPGASAAVGPKASWIQSAAAAFKDKGALAGQLAAAQARVTELEGQVTAKDAQVVELQGQLTAKDGVIAALTKDLDELKAAYEEGQKQVKTVEAKAVDLVAGMGMRPGTAPAAEKEGAKELDDLYAQMASEKDPVKSGQLWKQIQEKEAALAKK